MDPTLVEYIGFVVAALILGWAVFELNSRYFRQKKAKPEPPNTWVKLDSTRGDDREDSLPVEDGDEEKEVVPGPDIHTLAQQNGHHSQSKKLL
jgi:hypothetical protein